MMNTQVNFKPPLSIPKPPIKNDDAQSLMKTSSKVVKQLNQAKEAALQINKKGIQKAMVQYKFEQADKEEENSFKGLLDTLNEFL